MPQAVALYFCAADVVLIAQVLYYSHVNSREKSIQASTQLDEDDRPGQPLLSSRPSDIGLPGSRRRSSVSQKVHRAATLPIISRDSRYGYPWLRNSLSVFAVCALGAMGWYVAFSVGIWKPTIEDPKDPTHDNLPAQILGYLSAVRLSLSFMPLTRALS